MGDTISELLGVAIGFAIDFIAALIVSFVAWLYFSTHKFLVLLAAVFFLGIFLRYHTIFALKRRNYEEKEKENV